ncbi:MAG TPA: PAS domain S-box protein [Gemmataceae bacterium]|nr:PAS domain S-box protein [Gemmataceae bacterium]
MNADAFPGAKSDSSQPFVVGPEIGPYGFAARPPNGVPDSAVEPEAAQGREQAQRLLYQELIEFAPDGYLVTDLSGVIREVNSAAAALLNSRKEFLLGKPLPFFVAADQRPAFYNQLLQLGHLGRAVRDWDVRLRPINREPIDATLSAAAIPDKAGLPVGLRWTLRDVTARKRTEQALLEEKRFADVLVDTAPTAILVIDTQGRLLRTNPYVGVLCSCDPRELLGQDWRTLLVAEEDRQRADEMLQALALGARAGGLFALAARDGRRRAIAWTGRCLTQTAERTTVLLTGQDVTALQEAQQKALQAERLAAIGQMVTGLAHESRNALQRNQACLSVLALRLKDRPEELDILARMQRAQDDLHRLYEEVRGYAAPIHLATQVCRLATLWQEAWADLGPLREGKGAQLREEAGSDEWECLADPFYLKQVFRNLLENALAAGGNPPQVEIRCSSARIEGRPAVQIAVRDNGPGFDPEQRAKLFEPFFTTKLRGTGLGLALCKRAIEAHGGRIEVGDGPGAEIIILLPRGEA